MTKEQRAEIRELQAGGLGYVRIARKLGISENTVKSYLRRNAVAEETEKSVCQCCGTPVIQNPHRKQKKFCSDACRMKWWNSHPEQVNRKKIYKYICPTCGKSFSVYGGSQRKYCCHECYVEDRFGGCRHE